MISKLRTYIESHWSAFGREDICDTEELSFTKFCQRIVHEHTKVLFLVTYKGESLCVIKVMRNAAHNADLKHEIEAQKDIEEFVPGIAPKVFCTDVIDGLFISFEEVIEGRVLSVRSAKKHIGAVLKYIQSFPKGNRISTDVLARVCGTHTDSKNGNLQFFIQKLQEAKIAIHTGFTHGDLGRVNILQEKKRMVFVDWGRAHERPIYLLDAVYFIVKVHGIGDFHAWKEKGVPVLVEHTGCTEEEAGVLYCVLMIFEILSKKYPDEYVKLQQEVTKLSI